VSEIIHGAAAAQGGGCTMERARAVNSSIMKLKKSSFLTEAPYQGAIIVYSMVLN
jgi:hypothetical protein